MAENSPYRGSRSLRVLEFLEALISMDRPMSIFEIMRETGLPKATAHRLCSLLEGEGFIAQEIGRKGLIFGHRTQELALGVMASGGVDAYRHQILMEVSRDIGETCNLTVPQGSPCKGHGGHTK